MWNIALLDDPLSTSGTTASTNTMIDSDGDATRHSDNGMTVDAIVPLPQQEYSRIASCTCSLSNLLGVENACIIRAEQVQKYRRVGRIALADYVARMIAVRTLYLQESQPQQLQLQPYAASSSSANTNHEMITKGNSFYTRIEPLDRTTTTNRNSNGRRQLHRQVSCSLKGNCSMKHITPVTATTKNSIPYILERSDVTTTPITTTPQGKQDDEDNDYQIHIYVRVFIYSDTAYMGESDDDDDDDDSIPIIQRSVSQWMQQILDFTSSVESMNHIMTHIAIAILQEKLRSELRIQDTTSVTNTTDMDGPVVMTGGCGVAFIANGSILPRKSGASTLPMSSPPAIPFMAPENSTMYRTIPIDMGQLTQYLIDYLPSGSNIIENTTIISISGLLIRRGVSLIVGGGYHGKSTLLRCIAAGVYNKMIRDGREFCVTVSDALMVRAEDGRYVHNCNVSAFISNLPIPNVDTKHFSTKDASGSTSQASNVVEAIEMGVSAMLIDEDVSAANFMARDGRMRSLVMDESITPLLYRVNGLFRSHGISSIVVVGGVGDWLDVPDNVILLDRYICYDATAKARSISKQFSHGHVQYAGRGVVHRLNWDKGGNPLLRRPTPSNKVSYKILTTGVTLLDGSNSIALYNLCQSNHASLELTNGGTDENDDDDDDEQYIDMSRCEQLLGKKPELYGCGLCVAWLLNYSKQHPEFGVSEMLQKMDDTFDKQGWSGIIKGCPPNESGDSHAWRAMVECLGFAYRPRRFEVGQALTRYRAISFVDIPIEDDGSEEAARIEAERKRNELLAIWNNRKKKTAD